MHDRQECLLTINPDISNYVSGYYQVGNDLFVNKAEALLHASKARSWPKYHFYNDVWKKQNWTNPANTNIYDLYRRRARQLREKYDYVCLSFSGGSDSTTALQAFIDTNSHINEIMVKWPIQATEHVHVSRSRNPDNYISEWALTIKPMLAQIAQQLGPRTKITVMDWSQNVAEKYLPENVLWQLNGSDHLNPSMIKHIQPSDLTRAAIESGLRTCIVFGRDKPQIYHRKGRIYCSFRDTLVKGHTFAPWDKHIELFYYTPDVPEIVPAQAQIIFRHLQSNPQLIQLIDFNNKNYRDSVVWNETVKCLIYPDYTAQNWFQAKKPTSLIHDEIDQWMYANPVTSMYIQSWRSQIGQRLNMIDDRFIEKNAGIPAKLLGFVASTHLVGVLDHATQ